MKGILVRLVCHRLHRKCAGQPRCADDLDHFRRRVAVRKGKRRAPHAEFAGERVDVLHEIAMKLFGTVTETLMRVRLRAHLKQTSRDQSSTLLAPYRTP